MTDWTNGSCSDSADGQHTVYQETRTETDGSTRQVYYCIHCGWER